MLLAFEEEVVECQWLNFIDLSQASQGSKLGFGIYQLWALRQVAWTPKAPVPSFEEGNPNSRELELSSEAYVSFVEDFLLLI